MNAITQELVPVFVGAIQGQPVQLVDLRLLHGFLEIARDFPTWIKDRIEEYRFLKDQDFIEFSPKSGKKGRPTIEYHGCLDMAKELSMVERNEKGRQARRYFIECERQLLEQNQVFHREETPPEFAHSRTRIVLVLENGQVVESSPLSDTACVVDPQKPLNVLTFFRERIHGDLLTQVVLDGVARLSHMAMRIQRPTLANPADPWQAPILAWLEGHDFVTVREVLTQVLNLPVEQHTEGASSRVRVILKRAGWEGGKGENPRWSPAEKKTVRGWRRKA